MKRENSTKHWTRNLAALCLIVLASAASAAAQTTAFTFQGRLTDTQATGGSYDLRFTIKDTASGPPIPSATPIPPPPPVALSNVTVTNGIFTVELDFGSSFFDGNDRWLEIEVKRPGETTYTTLNPRQKISSAPYAIRSLTAETANNATQLNNQDGSLFVRTDDVRLFDSRQPTAESSNYIQNQNTAAQTSANFNISGTGAANIFNAQTQFNINGVRILSNAGTNNLFAGNGAGNSTTGAGNSFFGVNAGQANTSGQGNSIFGSNAGRVNSTGSSNVFFGVNAGLANLSGGGNTFVGTSAGNFNSSGHSNAFFGVGAGSNNSVGFNNTFIGESSNSAATNFSFAAAFGSNAVATGSDTIVIGKTATAVPGRPADTVIIPGTLNASVVNVGVVNAATQFNIGGSRVLIVTPVTGNTFVGRGAGLNNPTGAQNTFLGEDAGRSTTTGSSNVFAGLNAGYSNTTGFDNSFVGRNVGFMNTGGSGNSFYGRNAGFSTTTGTQNVFLGRDAGYDNVIGGENAFVGTDAGSNNTTGVGNSFFGTSAGTGNTAGNNNTLIGNSANISNTRNFATAIGAFAIVGDSDSIVLGKVAGTYNSESRPADAVRIPGTLDVNGVINTGAQYNIGGTRVLSVPGGTNVFVGADAGSFNVSGGNNTIIGANANVAAGNFSYTTVIGSGASSFESNSIVLGRNDASDTLRIPGKVKLNTFGSAGLANLCINAGLEISGCSSSLRYKTNIAPFNFGLNLVNRLKPITFDWKDGGMHDLGLGAEDVAAIEPLLVTYNKSGQIEGVKYDRIGVVLLNAVKEQQTQIEAQQKQIDEQNALIDGLRKLICAGNPTAAVCQ